MAAREMVVGCVDGRTGGERELDVGCLPTMTLPTPRKMKEGVLACYARVQALSVTVVSENLLVTRLCVYKFLPVASSINPPISCLIFPLF